MGRNGVTNKVPEFRVLNVNGVCSMWFKWYCGSGGI